MKEKPYLCEVCEIKFAMPGSLKSHSKNYTRKKTFSFNICDKIFVRKAHLTSHEGNYTTENRLLVKIVDDNVQINLA